MFPILQSAFENILPWFFIAIRSFAGIITIGSAAAIFNVLYYTGQVFDDEILKQYMEAFRTPEGEALLNCYDLCAKERKEWKYDFKTRLEADNLYDLIKDDLTEKDHEKIAINKRIFMGVSE